jgi:YVTN family beta-propeller protein
VVAVVAILMGAAATSINAANPQATTSFQSNFVPVPQSPSSMAFDPNNGFLYVSYGDGTEGGVSVIDGTANIANLTLDSGPGPLTYNPSNHLVYAAGINGKEVAIINGTSIIATLPTSYPVIFAYDAFNGLVYLAGGGITVINGTSIAGHLSGGCGGMTDCALAFNPSNGIVYVPNTRTNTTSVINATRVISTVQMDGSPVSATFNPTNGLVYVTIVNYGYGDKVAVINGTELISTIAVGVDPADLLYDPINGYIYVSNNGAEALSVIEGTSNLANVSLGFRPFGAVYDPSTGFVYYPNQGGYGVSVVNGTKVIGAVRTGPRPTYALFNPSNNLIYVSNSGFTGMCAGCPFEPSNVVSLVKGTSFVENVTVGYGPGSMIYDTSRNSVDVLVGNGVSEISPSNSSTTSTTNFGLAPRLQISGYSFNASVGTPLDIMFNVTTYQPGTLYWSVVNGTGATAFLTYSEIQSGSIPLPSGLTVTYPDGISSSGNKTNVVAILTFSPSTAGKTFPLALTLLLVPEGDPMHPISTAESLVVTVGHVQQASAFPWELVGLVGIGALFAVVAVGLLWYRKSVSQNEAWAHKARERRAG